MECDVPERDCVRNDGPLYEEAHAHLKADDHLRLVGDDHRQIREEQRRAERQLRRHESPQVRPIHQRRKLGQPSGQQDFVDREREAQQFGLAQSVRGRAIGILTGLVAAADLQGCNQPDVRQKRERARRDVRRDELHGEREAEWRQAYGAGHKRRDRQYRDDLIIL